MISQTWQRFIMGAMVAVAIGLIALGAVYQTDTPLGGPNIVGGDATPTPSATADDPVGGDDGGGSAIVTEAGTAGAAGPIEGFFPLSGEASACREPIGVDLANGFGARLTINGVEIAPEQMNVNFNDDGEISDVITASRSLGHYTFDPDDNCPNGRFLRPVANLLEVCVFRLDDTARRCAVRTENVFDAA